MATGYIIFLVIFIVLLSLFAYMGTRNGFVKALYSFLRIAVPMLLSGIIVKIVRLIPNQPELVSYIIGGIGTVIFFLVLRTVITTGSQNTKMGIFDYFLGFLLGITEGWLIVGFIVMYLDFFKIVSIQSLIHPTFYQTIIKPVDWILFLSFIRF
jgi:hypothetical protein